MNQTTSLTLDNFICPIRTLVVDDSLVMMQSLCEYLRARPLFQLVGAAMGGREALLMADLFKPDLVLMDLRMPDLDGLQTTAILRRRTASIRIIIMTVENAATAEPEARAHGAHGFILKSRIMEGLMTEVRRVFHWADPKDEKTSS